MTEIYSIITDFGGVYPNLSQLHSEIASNIGILKTLIGITTLDADVVHITFNLTLSGGEKIILDGLITSHVPLIIPITNNNITLIPNKSDFKNMERVRILTTELEKTTYATAKSISYMDTAVTSYDINIIDKNNKTVLLSKNLTNTLESIQDLGELVNLPLSKTQIEISIKKNGGNKKDKIHIQSIIIDYI